MENTRDKLKQASDGLLFMSESDQPFETVAFPAGKLTELDAESLKAALQLPPGTPVEEQELAYFFRNQTRDLPEHGEDDKKRAQRFRELEQVLKQELQHVKVFRVGEMQVDAYILGRIADGSIGGLKTKLIET